MDYVIECRFSKAFASSQPVRDIFPASQNAVLFSFAFSDPIETPHQQAAGIVQNIIEDVQRESSPTLVLDVDSVKGSRGSIIITVLVLDIVLNLASPIPPNGVGGVGGIALWAADKALGGALSEFGKALAQHVQDVISHNGLFHQSPSPIRDPQAIARERADSIALERNCVAVQMAGGVRVDLSNGQDHGYKYTYQLVGVMPGYVTVVVDQHARQPVEYHVFERLPAGSI